MQFIKGTKVRITFPNSQWFKDEGKIGAVVSYNDNHSVAIYIEGSEHNHDQVDYYGNKYTWIMYQSHFKVLGQVQLLFPFMKESYV